MAPETRAMKKQKTGASSSVQLISSGSSSSGGDNGSRSRSPSPHSGGDGDTVDSGEHSSDSEVSVPEALLAEPDWCGYAADAHVRCHCGKRAVRKVAWGGKACERRFYGCDDEGDGCSFVEWVDDPWTPRVQKTMGDLTSVINSWKADCTDAEEEAAEAKAVEGQA
ncbi:hypothetical protein EJB05_04162 [Eragrostis curvula]|uniref:GRF-type domain-containing protein n=1 Tax=Eragrostis curvula TaxID=38414 RepID=A0A5J9W9R4_9POAL|nr:hypothetical protein EJB05_04162 [Eragrostis curvula]